jgi:glucuronate isomerase
MFERFNIELLATTDAATDTLEHHKAIRESGWKGRIIPTFRPDNVTNLEAPGWRKNIDRLSQVSGIDVKDYHSFVQALEQRRAYFKEIGATATDSGVFSPATIQLSENEAAAIFDRPLKGDIQADDTAKFTAHMLLEMARMSAEDGLVMQIHPAVHRNHNPQVFEKFGADRGFDIPASVEYVRNLKPLLDRYGNDLNFTLLLFTLDETTYARELAPLAGAYPAVRLGPPWWFVDSWNGMKRYFDQVMETAGLYNTAGFNDDTRAFPSIPARHDVWRRASANWLGNLVVRGLIDCEEAEGMAKDMATDLAKKVYKVA